MVETTVDYSHIVYVLDRWATLEKAFNGMATVSPAALLKVDVDDDSGDTRRSKFETLLDDIKQELIEARTLFCEPATIVCGDALALIIRFAYATVSATVFRFVDNYYSYIGGRSTVAAFLAKSCIPPGELLSRDRRYSRRSIA